MLVDTGASASVVLGEHCTKLKMKSAPTTTWTTKAGTFTTTQKAQLKFILPKFSQSKTISWACCHMDDIATASNSQYNMILGRDLLETPGFIINFNGHTMTWDEATILMKEYGSISTLHAADAYCNEILGQWKMRSQRE